MSYSEQIIEPKLAKPGAGLPFYEWAVANYILLPGLFKRTDKKEALTNFAGESNKLISLASKLSISDLSQRRLIPRLRGLEDSSRYYSVAMTLDHLVIVGTSIRQVILDLSNGSTSLTPRGIAAFKPNAEVNAENIVSLFEQMSKQFLLDVETSDINAYPQATYPHPWFGPFNARKWLILAASHQNVHRQQIKEIISRL